MSRLGWCRGAAAAGNQEAVGGGHDVVSSEAIARVKQCNLHVQFRAWPRIKPMLLESEACQAPKENSESKYSFGLPQWQR